MVCEGEASLSGPPAEWAGYFQGIQGSGVQEEEPEAQTLGRGLVSSNPSLKSGPPASISDSSISFL